MNKNSKILITGAKGMVGKNLTKELENQGYTNLVLSSHNTLDLIKREEVFNFFKKNKPEYIFHLASKVGGIKDNLEHPVEFMRDNIILNTNVIDAGFNSNVKKLIILNSATIYSTKLDFPKEENLFEGKLEKENEAYGLSKICGIKLCEYYNKEYNTNFINLATTNIYGEFSKFNVNKSNVVAALIMRFHSAKINNKKDVKIWGSGNVRREFIYAMDLSKLMILAMNKINKKDTENGLLNCGLNDEFSIKELAETIKKIVGFSGEIIFDTTKPEGVKRRAIDSSKFQKLINFKEKTSLEEGLKEMYEYYLRNL